MPECNKLFSNRQPIINPLSAFLIKYSWALNCQKLSCAVSLQHLRGKNIYIDEKHVVNRRILWFPLLRCIKKTTSRFTWHFLRCISSFNVVRCIHPINVIDLINIQINTFTWWKWFHILSNRSTQCLDAKPALPLKGNYQDSGPDAISLESSEWMCGINALMRFDTTVVYNTFEVRSLFPAVVETQSSVTDPGSDGLFHPISVKFWNAFQNEVWQKKIDE